MTKLALVCVVLAAACSKKDDPRAAPSQGATATPTPAQPADPGTPTAARKPARPSAPEDKNRTCHIVGSGAVAFEQTSHDGGPVAMVVKQWQDPATEGLALNCNGDKMSLNVLTPSDKPFPAQPAKYVIGGGYAPVRVLGTIKDGTEYKIIEGNGELEITAFDDKHVAGKGSFVPKTSPDRPGVNINFDFDIVREAAPSTAAGSGSGSATSPVHGKK